MDPAGDLDELERSAGTEALLKATCRALTSTTDADACMISRVLGDLLISIAEWAVSGESLQLGHGYLLPDFPVTAEVLERIEPRLVALVWNTDRALERPIDTFVRAAQAACADLGLAVPQPISR